jgi:hypothetical protein
MEKLLEDYQTLLKLANAMSMAGRRLQNARMFDIEPAIEALEKALTEYETFLFKDKE